MDKNFTFHNPNLEIASHPVCLLSTSWKSENKYTIVKYINDATPTFVKCHPLNNKRSFVI